VFAFDINKSDTDGEVIFTEASQSPNQPIERAPSVTSGLFQTSPSVSKVAKSQRVVTMFGANVVRTGD
jgi:hypothetical protein